MNKLSNSPSTASDKKSDAPVPLTPPLEAVPPLPIRPDPTRYGDWEKNGRCIDF